MDHRNQGRRDHSWPLSICFIRLEPPVGYNFTGSSLGFVIILQVRQRFDHSTRRSYRPSHRLQKALRSVGSGVDVPVSISPEPVQHEALRCSITLSYCPIHCIVATWMQHTYYIFEIILQRRGAPGANVFTICSIVGRLEGMCAQQLWIRFHVSSSISGLSNRLERTPFMASCTTWK